MWMTLWQEWGQQSNMCSKQTIEDQALEMFYAAPNQQNRSLILWQSKSMHHLQSSNSPISKKWPCQSKCIRSKSILSLTRALAFHLADRQRNLVLHPLSMDDIHSHCQHVHHMDRWYRVMLFRRIHCTLSVDSRQLMVSETVFHAHNCEKRHESTTNKFDVITIWTVIIQYMENDKKKNIIRITDKPHTKKHSSLK